MSDAMFAHVSDQGMVPTTEMLQMMKPHSSALLDHYQVSRPARPLFITHSAPPTKRRPFWPLLVGAAIAGAFIVMACAQVLRHLS